MWCSEHRLESLYWYVYHVLLNWCRKCRRYLDRNHWSLFPVVLDGRRLPIDVYDELQGILMHGCVGEFISSKFRILEKDATLVP